MTSTSAAIILAYRANVSLFDIVKVTGVDRDTVNNLIMANGTMDVETVDLLAATIR